MRPSEDSTVVDFSQFLSGPSVSPRRADSGAWVIGIERPLSPLGSPKTGEHSATILESLLSSTRQR